MKSDTKGFVSESVITLSKLPSLVDAFNSLIATVCHINFALILTRTTQRVRTFQCVLAWLEFVSM